MPRTVLIADVEESVQREEGFRTHTDLFRSQTITAIHFAVNEENRVALYAEVDDLDKYMEVLNSEATAEAMEHDGVKRDTVQLFVLDKQLSL